jgi:hypothetical protein
MDRDTRDCAVWIGKLLLITLGVGLACAWLCGDLPAQVLLISPQTPTLAPHDCPCTPVCKCDPCVCGLQTKPAVSVKKQYTPAEASYIVRNVIGKETFQCSGTAIDEHKLVTCWHLLRNGTGTLTVNGMPAKIVSVDSKSDVALLHTESSLKSVPVASEPLKAGESCTAYGYEYSRKGLFKFPSRITGINRYRGFPNVSILGRPQSGRSGGGLFNAAGELVGVCSAADGQEGLYCGLDAIKALFHHEVKPAPSVKQLPIPDSSNFPSGKNPNVKKSLTVPNPSKSTGLKPNLAAKTTPFFLQDCPNCNGLPGQCKPAPPLKVAPRQQAISGPVFNSCPGGQCPLVPKQAAPKSYPAAVGNPAGVSPGSSRACPTCPSARQNSPQTAVPSFPPYSRTRGIFFRGQR